MAQTTTAEMAPEERELLAQHLEAQAEFYRAKAKAKEIAARLAKSGSSIVGVGEKLCW